MLLNTTPSHGLIGQRAALHGNPLRTQTAASGSVPSGISHKLAATLAAVVS